MQQIVGYLGYTGRDANVVATAAHDPSETLAAKFAVMHNPALPPNVIASARPALGRSGRPREATEIHRTSREAP